MHEIGRGGETDRPGASDENALVDRHKLAASLDLRYAGPRDDVAVLHDLIGVELPGAIEVEADRHGAGLLEARAHGRVLERIGKLLVETLQDRPWRPRRYRERKPAVDLVLGQAGLGRSRRVGQR